MNVIKTVTEDKSVGICDMQNDNLHNDNFDGLVSAGEFEAGNIEAWVSLIKTVFGDGKVSVFLCRSKSVNATAMVATDRSDTGVVVAATSLIGMSEGD